LDLGTGYAKKNKVLKMICCQRTHLRQIKRDFDKMLLEYFFSLERKVSNRGEWCPPANCSCMRFVCEKLCKLRSTRNKRTPMHSLQLLTLSNFLVL
jgi:hypothetical protein